VDEWTSEAPEVEKKEIETESMASSRVLRDRYRLWTHRSVRVSLCDRGVDRVGQQQRAGDRDDSSGM